MKVEIISVGTEILLGDIINTNTQFLAKELAAIGIECYRQEVVGDNQDRLLGIFKEALDRSDMVITTGGLGPTNDDLTKETACKFFDMDLSLHEESLKALEQFFLKAGRKITESNYKQVYFPEKSIVLPNLNGTAPGAILEKDNKYIIILPGPPKEMKPMYLNYVKPYLIKKGDGIIQSKVLRVLGVGESMAAEKLKELINNSTNPTVAPYAKEEDLIFRITAKAQNEEKALKLIDPIKNEIEKVLGQNVYGEGEETTIEAVVGELLIKNQLKISTAESCTGGMIASRLISVSGISKVFLEGVVAYANDAKIRTLNVKESTLKKFGAVSEETAIEMVQGIAERMDSDIAIATTGIAGPEGGSEEKPVGLVYIALYYKGEVKVYKSIFNGDRKNIRVRATITALDIIRRKIIDKYDN